MEATPKNSIKPTSEDIEQSNVTNTPLWGYCHYYTEA